MDASTFTATLMPSRGHVEVVSGKRMSSQTMRLGLSACILGPCHEFHVVWSDTWGCPAKMVNGQTIGDRPNDKFVGDSMGEIGAVTRRVFEPPVWVGVACPKPTGVRLDYLRPELSREDRIELRHEVTPYGATEPDVHSVAAPLILSHPEMERAHA